MFHSEIQPSELRAALSQAIGSHRVGDVVCTRLHWQVPTSTCLEDVVRAGVELLTTALPLTTTDWRVRRSKLGALLHVMGTDDRGRTMVITVNHGDIAEAQLTVFGNHGVVRLDRAVLNWDSLSAPVSSMGNAWRQSLEVALQA